MNILKRISIVFLINSLLLFLISGCSKESKGKDIELGSTVKIHYQSDRLLVGDVDYSWSFNTKPESSRAILLCSRDKALFTPDEPGTYIIELLVTNQGIQTDLQQYEYAVEGGDESFSKPAIAETPQTQEVLETEVKKQAPQKKKSPEPEKKSPPAEKPAAAQKKPEAAEKKPIAEDPHFTIQISSQTTEKAANIDLKRITDMGFPGYLQVYKPEDGGQTWYRIRVGNFSNRLDAELMKSELSELLNIKGIWIDKMYSKDL